jgi:hypothetical protein
METDDVLGCGPLPRHRQAMYLLHPEEECDVT